MSLALTKVEASRARLRLAMLPPPQNEAMRDGTASWADKILQVPVVGAVIESVRAWWTSSPVRPVAEMATAATSATVKPIARHHPILFVLAAAAVGAALFWARPWRWIFRSALFAGLLPQLVMRTLATLPVDSWMSMLGSALSRSSARARPAPAEAAGQTATG